LPMTRFTDDMVPERVQPFWAALQRGEFITDAAAEPGPIASEARGGWPLAAGCARVAAAT